MPIFCCIVSLKSFDCYKNVKLLIATNIDSNDAKMLFLREELFSISERKIFLQKLFIKLIGIILFHITSTFYSYHVMYFKTLRKIALKPIKAKKRDFCIQINNNGKLILCFSGLLRRNWVHASATELDCQGFWWGRGRQEIRPPLAILQIAYNLLLIGSFQIRDRIQ